MMTIFLSDLLDREFWIGKEEWPFIWEIMLRTFAMFIVIILGIKMLGKRGVKQLSIFELVVVIGLGSAAGDPMFYKDVGVLSAVLVFSIVIFLYKLVTLLVEKIHPFELFLEGQPQIVIKEGRFLMKKSKKEDLGTEELFSALRMKNVSHLGQVKLAIEEISGDLSVFFFEDHQVKYGLPILPDTEQPKVIFIEKDGFYSCCFCAYTEWKKNGFAGICSKCDHHEWIESSYEKRIS